jgi:hypothetical protein
MGPNPEKSLPDEARNAQEPEARDAGTQPLV